MPTVSNTSPILNLAIIDQLSLLQHQFGTLWIPLAVLEELRLEENLPGSAVVRKGLDENWIQGREVQDDAIVRILQRDLDKGEAESIALALQLDADRVLIDEREARQVAKSLGLQVTGVLGILLRAKREGYLASLTDTISLLQDQAGLRIGQDLLSNILQAGGEG